MPLRRLKFALTAALSAALSAILIIGALLATAGARAQEPWPTRPVKIVSPFPAGGTSDVMEIGRAHV